ncbi:hypothetical protein LTR36_008268 [Oleoguttula mirabilis]|uniref:RING-type domain-containing protein n=1 Tax=Oleoguttula mirabilis TaxID=1507867 RepID=A0AAV9J8F0_9PEZI|nr:hypothetical protein LTR36_008268 [Oleoguttula mirabilis]
MGSGLRTWLALATLLSGALSQTISPANWTAADATRENDDAVGMVLSMGDAKVALAAVLPLTQSAGSDIPSSGLSGPVILADATNQLIIGQYNIALLCCDPSAYVGNIDALDVFGTAEQVNVTGIVWYSTEADYCALGQYSGSYAWVYSMKSVNDTQKMLDNINTLGEDRTSTVYMTIGQSTTATQAANSSTTSGDGGASSSASSSSSQSQNSNPLGPSPSTAVAMIILYSITGIITALFLVIIVTGAVRAHRHPERYGPRNIIGRARQSRARGLARAMLDTIPIVKFGEREPPKPTDVELAEGSSSISPTGVAQPHEVTDRSDLAASGAEQQQPAEDSRPSITEGGIAPATNREAEGEDGDHQGCSICTEDFEIGQDQRVLPCDHRFHPACIDPWLLNVSGTCPLCRIDLRPQTSRSSEPELDEHGNPVTHEGDENVEAMAPPLAMEGDARRTSVRRSLMLSLMGVGRPERLTREERVLALREYRGRVAARRSRDEQDAMAAAPATPATTQEEEHGLRTRLRNAFRIRTRRTAPEDVTSQPAGSSEG